MKIHEMQTVRKQKKALLKNKRSNHINKLTKKTQTIQQQVKHNALITTYVQELVTLGSTFTLSL